MNKPRIDSLRITSHDVSMFSNFKTLLSMKLKHLYSNSVKSHWIQYPQRSFYNALTSWFLWSHPWLISLSLASGQFSTQWKVAQVKPLLKKPGIVTEFSHLRPVSNLKYISKLVESAATQQILNHLNCISLLPPNQSAYRQFHSTETTPLGLRSDLLMAMDNQDSRSRFKIQIYCHAQNNNIMT